MDEDMDEEERRRAEEERLRRGYERERESHWRYYDSPRRRRFAEQYQRSRGTDGLLEGGPARPPHPDDPEER